jgi:hypothetical protein
VLEGWFVLVVILASLNTVGRSANSRFVVTSTEQNGAEPIFEIAQTAAESRLANTEGSRRLSQTAVLRRGDRQSQIVKLNRHDLTVRYANIV